jgi:hypothetical protein
MSDESADALHIGVGVAATCIGAMCSLYTCCRHVWRRLKGHTPAVAAGAAAIAGTMVASSALGGTPAARGAPGGRAEAPCSDDRPGCCARDDPGQACRSRVVSTV